MGTTKTIPKTIKLYGVDIVVEFDNELLEKENLQGCFIPNQSKIVLASKYKEGKKWISYPPQQVYSTFIHELTHCLLFISGSNDWDNEVFVSNFAGLLNQIIDEIVESERTVPSRSRSPRNGSGRVPKSSKKNKDL